jgi:hypothetical protein
MQDYFAQTKARVRGQCQGETAIEYPQSPLTISPSYFTQQPQLFHPATATVELQLNSSNSKFNPA